MDRNTIISQTVSEIIGVALRKESVDRNVFWMAPNLPLRRSLSARRAWIEIAAIRRAVWSYYVALRKESVDRNQIAVHFDTLSACRSPQGERG